MTPYDCFDRVQVLLRCFYLICKKGHETTQSYLTRPDSRLPGVREGWLYNDSYVVWSAEDFARTED